MKTRLLSLALLFFTLSTAQLLLADELSDFIDALHKKNFSGWEGVVFTCSYDEENTVLAKICARASVDIQFLAASSKINLHVAGPNKFFAAGLVKARKNYIGLKYRLTATKPPAGLGSKSIYGELSYEVLYTNAVKQGAASDSSGAIPRHGDLELWSDSVIAGGPAQNLVEPFSDAIEVKIKEAMTIFLKYAN